MLSPQEIELWYIIPAIRRELFYNLSKDSEYSQKEIAKILGVTGAAVSQYKKEKRGKLTLPENAREEIKRSTGNIVNSSSTVFSETQRLLKYMRDTLTICEIHKLMDDTLPNDCGACGEYL